MRYFILLAFVFCGCAGKRTYSRYELINSTDHEIVIRSYSRGESGVRKVIEINGQDQWRSIEYETSRGSSFLAEDAEIFDGDSLTITFDQERIFKFSINLIDSRNLFHGNTYERMEYADHKTALRYVFTESDFNAAELID